MKNLQARPRDPSTSAQDGSVLWRIVTCVVLVGLIWFVFGQTIRFPFVSLDDPEYVYEVPEINHGLTWHGVAWAFTHFPSPNWYPLTNISHMVEFQLFGMNAGPYHLTNVLLHTIAALLLFLLLCSLGSARASRAGFGALAETLGPAGEAKSAIAGAQSPAREARALAGTANTIWASAFVAAIFAIHPLRVESVAWVIERKDVLSGVFFMLTLAAYVWYTRKRSIARYLTLSILLACGLMSKPMLITTPVVLLLLDYWPLGRITFGGTASVPSGRDRARPSTGITVRQAIVEKIPLFALSLVLAFIASSGIAQARDATAAVPFIWRIGNAFVSYVVYIGQMIWPANLAVWYPHLENRLPVWEIAIAATFVIGVTILAVALRKSRPYFFVGWFWYLVMLAPVIGVVQVNLQAHADRYTYLPQIGLYLIIAWGVADVVRFSSSWALDVGRWGLGVCCLGIIVALAFTARAQTTHWRDSEALWTRAIAVTKDNAFAHASLSDLLMRRGRLDEAITHSEEALRIRPDHADAQNNLGLALLQKGDEHAAAEHFRKCLGIDPDHMNAMVNLAWILATSGDSSTRDGAKAVELAEKVNQRAGHANVIVLRTLAAGYAQIGRFEEAIQIAEQAIRLARAQGNAGLADDLQRNIDSYRAKRPLRSR